MNSSSPQVVHDCEASQPILARAAADPRRNTDHPTIRIHNYFLLQAEADEQAGLEIAFLSRESNEHFPVQPRSFRVMATQDSRPPSSRADCRLLDHCQFF